MLVELDTANRHDLLTNYSHHGTETLKIYVSSKQKLCVLLRPLLCHASPYFQTCLTGTFKEVVKGELFFHEETSETFDNLVLWTYFHELTPNNFADKSFVDTYVLADELCMEAF